MITITGRTALISGSSRGIGRGIEIASDLMPTARIADQIGVAFPLSLAAPW